VSSTTPVPVAAAPRTHFLKRAPARVLRTVRRELTSWQQTQELRPVLERIRPYSMVPEFSLVHLAGVVNTVIKEQLAGNFVECGTWRGGASFLMAELLRKAGDDQRTVWLCDSFEGHRPPEDIDGHAALEYAANTDDPEYLNNCRADLDDVQRSARVLGLETRTAMLKGWFDESLPANKDRFGKIAILRIDCDWYSSVKTVLEELYDQVVDGGFVIFDDYFSYDGCAVAAHEFLGARKLSHRLHTEGGVAYFRKD
jgi:O-methyltransferase